MCWTSSKKSCTRHNQTITNWVQSVYDQLADIQLRHYYNSKTHLSQHLGPPPNVGPSLHRKRLQGVPDVQRTSDPHRPSARRSTHTDEAGRETRGRGLGDCVVESHPSLLQGTGSHTCYSFFRWFVAALAFWRLKSNFTSLVMLPCANRWHNFSFFVVVGMVKLKNKPCMWTQAQAIQKLSFIKIYVCLAKWNHLGPISQCTEQSFHSKAWLKAI